MSDREMLELAAKAAGMKGWQWVESWGSMAEKRLQGGFYFDRYWNPLEDDGDALRLAVKIYMFDGSLFKRFMAIRLEEIRLNSGRSDEEITRRAIVRAAAEIGKGLSQPITNDVPEDNPS